MMEEISAASGPKSLGWDEIRVLHLLPGVGDEEIRCHRRAVSLSDLPSYHALSYVWGDPCDTREIYIDGAAVQVTKNLFAALGAVRLSGQPLEIWVDAICIDQSDYAEKTHQVDLMRRIYRECESCFIWLGEITVENDTGEVALNAASAALDALRICSNEQGLDWPARDPVGGAEGFTAAAALQAMMDSPWWQRIWTVQEVCLPPKAVVLWGSLSIPWSTVGRAADNLLSDDECPSDIDPFDLFPGGNTGPFTIPVVCISQAKEWAEDDPEPIFKIWRFRDRFASDERDKIYGIMGLLGAGLLPSVTSCDYSLDKVTLFTRVTLDLLQSQNSLKVLVGWRNERVTAGLPSWVLDMARPNDRDQNNKFWDHSVFWDDFDAGRSLRPFNLERKAEDTELAHRFLNVSGVRIDRVASIVGDIVPINSAMDEIHVNISRWREIMEKFSRLGNDRGHILHAFEDLVKGLGVVEDLHRWTEMMCAGQCLFITEDNRVGLGPPETSLHDAICILSGGNVPFILRQNTEQEGITGFWELVGDCFVAGVMQGEAGIEATEEQIVLG